MTEFALDSATQLESVSDRHLRSTGGEMYWNFQSAFGGWALALGYSAIQQAEPQTAMLASITASFLKPLPKSGIDIEMRILRKGRRTSFLRTEFTGEDAPSDPIFTANYVFSDMKENALDYACEFPDVKSPETSPRLPDAPGPKFLSRYEQRVARGKPFSAQERPHSAFWVRDAEDRPWDAKALLAVSDTPMPRTFFLDPTPRFGATVQYDMHLFCTQADLDALAGGFVLVEATSDRVFSGRFSQTTRIWSQDRKLLAISNQLAFY
ncbi:thioesterase family protein [uncultured Erythrobacter sp.]|uniref:acyl-CoA thioesterase n=1 Tax=uncultured Erythrobacter sp. TaxID=263913 RepID=UPI00260B867E|nr:thioesterase family protein [uncultured Erythrobacter sp.]